MTGQRVLFAGTPEFARVSLSALIAAGHKPIAVYTQPDRPAGRGKRLTQSAVKHYAEQQGIVVHQPPTLRDAAAISAIKALAPDLIVVAAYGLVLPQAVLDIPRRGCLNVHASLLPRWRGAAPIVASILARDKDTGISLMDMDAGLDTGPVYVRESIAVNAGETAGELHDRLAALGGDLLVRHINDILDDTLQATPQNEREATYAAKVLTADAKLDWSRSADDLTLQVRAYNPTPGAWFLLAGERIKCWDAAVDDSVCAEPGSFVPASTGGIAVACAHGGLELRSLQRPGRRPVSGREFAAQVVALL